MSFFRMFAAAVSLVLASSSARAGCAVATNYQSGPFNIPSVNGVWYTWEAAAQAWTENPFWSNTNAHPSGVWHATILSCSRTGTVTDAGQIAFCTGRVTFPDGTYTDGSLQVSSAVSSASTLTCAQKNNGPQNCVGNPINAANGNKFESETDYSSGVLSLRRFYNRYGINPGPWGAMWGRPTSLG